MATDQLVPYWDAVKQQFQGPANVPSGSVETMQFVQLAAASVASQPLGIVSRAGIITGARVAAKTAATGNAIYTVDVKKNGVSILSAVIQLDNSVATLISKVGALAVANTPVAVGDFIELVIVAAIGTGTLPALIVAQVEFIFN